MIYTVNLDWRFMLGLRRSDMITSTLTYSELYRLESIHTARGALRKLVNWKRVSIVLLWCILQLKVSNAAIYLQ